MTATDDDRKKAQMLQGMLMDAMHAMKSLDEVEGLEQAAESRDQRSLVNRITGMTGSALRFAARSTDTSLRVGRALINSQDQLRMMLTAGQSLKDIREVRADIVGNERGTESQGQVCP